MSGNYEAILSHGLVVKCDDFANRLIEAYRSGNNEASRAYSRDGMETNFTAQSLAKQGETALALILRLDPLKAVEWRVGIDGCRAGYDLLYKNIRIDAKTIGPSRKFLIWPRAKNSLFESKQFDVLALMQNIEADRPVFRWTGWIGKEEFRLRRSIADKTHQLQEGTRFMGRAQLYPPNLLGDADAFARYKARKAGPTLQEQDL